MQSARVNRIALSVLLFAAVAGAQQSSDAARNAARALDAELRHLNGLSVVERAKATHELAIEIMRQPLAYELELASNCEVSATMDTTF